MLQLRTQGRLKRWDLFIQSTVNTIVTSMLSAAILMVFKYLYPWLDNKLKIEWLSTIIVLCLVFAMVRILLRYILTGWCLLIKRLHDFDTSGWWLLLPIILSLYADYTRGPQYEARSPSPAVTELKPLDEPSHAAQLESKATLSDVLIEQAQVPRPSTYIIGALYLMLLIMPGSRGTNKYGDP